MANEDKFPDNIFALDSSAGFTYIGVAPGGRSLPISLVDYLMVRTEDLRPKSEDNDYERSAVSEWQNAKRYNKLSKGPFIALEGMVGCHKLTK